jgi:hypothetical protein
MSYKDIPRNLNYLWDRRIVTRKDPDLPCTEETIHYWYYKMDFVPLQYQKHR